MIFGFYFVIINHFQLIKKIIAKLIIFFVKNVFQLLKFDIQK